MYLIIARISPLQSYIPYRDSKMTRILQESLGECSATIIENIADMLTVVRISQIIAVFNCSFFPPFSILCRIKCFFDAPDSSFLKMSPNPAFQIYPSSYSLPFSFYFQRLHRFLISSQYTTNVQCSASHLIRSFIRKSRNIILSPHHSRVGRYDEHVHVICLTKVSIFKVATLALP